MEQQLEKEKLEEGLAYILQSPKENGVLEMIVARPKENERIVFEEGQLDPDLGLLNDSWSKRGSRRTVNGGPNADQQLNIMNSRVIDLLSQERENWKLAGDQLFVDFDLSDHNLPPGSQLWIGDTIIEVTSVPHNGCKKFALRFGIEAVKFVNSTIGKKHHFRGINARVIRGGTIKTGDIVKKLH